MKHKSWVAVLLVVTAWAAMTGPASYGAPWAPKEPYDPPIRPMRAQALAYLPLEPWLAGHRGIDLAAHVGQEVVAPAGGTVAFVGVVVNRPVVTVRHDDGAVTSVEPVVSELVVGDRVARGDTLGTVDAAPGHCAPEACVHWGVRVAGDYIDPLDVLRGYGPVVLLPRSAGARRRHTHEWRSA